MPKISQFPAGGVAQNTDLIPIVRNGGDYTVTGYNLASLASYGQAYVGTFTATAGQTVFTLPSSPGSSANLAISVDGSTMVPGTDYNWTTPTTLTFTTGLTVGQTVLYRYTTSVPIGTSLAGGVSGQVQYNNSGVLNGTTIGGDATLVATTGVMKVNSVQASAIVDASLSASSQIYAVNQTYNRTAAEISAGVTPTNYGYQTGDIRRYGFIGNGSAADTAALAAQALLNPYFDALNYPSVPAQANPQNGYKHSLTLQSKTGLLGLAANSQFQYGATAFTGNYYDDAVLALGYNVNTSTGVDSTTRDTFSSGLFFETNYEHQFDSGTASAGTTTTTLNDSGKAWKTDQFIGWTLYNVTRGLSGKITANSATSITTSDVLSGQASGDSYQVLEVDMETYIQWAENDGTYRSFRPWMFTFDRGTAKAQAAKGSNGKIPISAATNTSPVTFTTTVNHGLQNSSLVKIYALAGGTWSTLNGLQVYVTVTGDKTFTAFVDGTGLGTYTASSGTIRAEPSMSSFIMSDAANGFAIRTPSWDTAATDNVARFLPGTADFYPQPQSTYTMRLHAGSGGSSQLYFQWAGLDQARLVASYTGQLNCYVSNGGANELLAGFAAWRSATRVNWSFGLGNVQIGVVNVNNNGGTTSVPLLHLRGAVSQVGNYLEAYQNDGTTLVYSVDVNGISKSTVLTVATLPVAATAGAGSRSFVSDANATMTAGIGAIVVGGGANKVPVYCDGTNWRIG